MSAEILELSIESMVEEVTAVDAAVRELAGALGFGERDAHEIELAIHETVINAIRHGNRCSPELRVDVTLRAERGALVAEVRDRGAGFDPAAVPSPLDAERLLLPSGRGLLYTRTFMDEVEYSAPPEGGMLVRMTKRTPSSSSG